MSKYDDEFKNVKKGVPSENTNQKVSVNYLMIFIVVGLIFAILILIFQDSILNTGNGVIGQSGYVLGQIVINSILALFTGSIQAWIFKSKIKSRVYVFIGFSLLGGVIAGLIGGLAMDSGLRNSFFIGALTGALIGGISSAAQNGVMGNKKYGQKWFAYSMISWLIIFSVGWTIGWDPTNGLGLAVAAGFLMIASGVSLVIFLNSTPQIEFS